jgi:hypothetical protein
MSNLNTYPHNHTLLIALMFLIGCFNIPKIQS